MLKEQLQSQNPSGKSHSQKERLNDFIVQWREGTVRSHPMVQAYPLLPKWSPFSVFRFLTRL